MHWNIPWGPFDCHSFLWNVFDLKKKKKKIQNVCGIGGSIE